MKWEGWCREEEYEPTMTTPALSVYSVYTFECGFMTIEKGMKNFSRLLTLTGSKEGHLYLYPNNHNKNNLNNKGQFVKERKTLNIGKKVDIKL